MIKSVYLCGAETCRMTEIHKSEYKLRKWTQRKNPEECQEGGRESDKSLKDIENNITDGMQKK